MSRKRKQPDRYKPQNKRAKYELEEEEDGEIQDSEDEWAEDLMGDEEDRIRLLNLPELEREKILYERGQRRLQRQERREAMLKLKQEGGDMGDGDLPTGIEDVSDVSESDDGEEDYIPQPEAPAPPPPVSQEPALSDSDDEPLVQLEEQQPKESTLTLDVMKKAQVRREALEKIHHEPWMPQFVQHLYVKLCLGEHNGEPLYRICQIAGLDNYHRSYRFGGKTTDQALILRIESKKRLFKMQLISNQSFSQPEFETWKSEQLKIRREIPTSEHLQDLVLKKMRFRKNFTYTPEQLRKIERDKQREKFRDLTKISNLLATKLQVKMDKQKAEYRKDTKTVEKLEHILRKIQQEENRRARNAAKSQTESINARNREKIREKMKILRHKSTTEKEKDAAGGNQREMYRPEVERFGKKQKEVEDDENEQAPDDIPVEDPKEDTVFKIEVRQVANPDEITAAVSQDAKWTELTALYNKFVPSFDFKPALKTPEPFLSLATNNECHYGEEYTRKPKRSAGGNLKIMSLEEVLEGRSM